ncbi:MarR family winged helix-turn-helix transcriptional regulator [Streptomyces sp. NRRL F-5126]|uniref:MarR family winged helix-turn-helix transcriptional regulator n=1 Tax=Streptomyces sp. NRRL F-5126 TaxID=1463857 RepID=UPI00099E1955|nr:MarR family winged helix-turn-helix transcriptional regulator [Streptomyces sp. NRRL F-5126]
MAKTTPTAPADPVAPVVPARIRALPSRLLGGAAARGHRLVAAALAEAGLRMVQYAVLSAVAESGPVSQAALARGLGIDPKHMVTVLGELQADGLLARAPDARDRRKNAVTISPAGRRRLAVADELGYRADDELTSDLTPAERARLVALLERVVRPGEPCAAGTPDAQPDVKREGGRPKARVNAAVNAAGDA